jgi:DNA-binding beta-propeller fold protein YncE
VSVIDLERALAGDRRAEILRIPTQIGPWGIVASPNGRWIVAANRESQKVALAKDPGAEVARIPIVRPAEPDGAPIRASRPKGSAVTSDGRYAVISAGPRVTLNPFLPTGTVSIIDLKRRAVVATVTGVGNDPYGLAVVDREDD